MVRVISAHHFESQSIQTCEDALAITIAPPSKLLVALSHHIIQVRDLAAPGKALYSFPTIDQVQTIVHSSTGNYIATLEKKKTRNGSETTYTRVYANWDSAYESMLTDKNSQPIRARIAGKVTPSSSQINGESLEMIELPVKYVATSAIACCQTTGNLVVGCHRSISLFQFVLRTHDISRLKFLDFELWPITLELNFEPTFLSLTEDIIAAMNRNTVHVFRINKGVTYSSIRNDPHLKSSQVDEFDTKSFSRHPPESSDEKDLTSTPPTIDLNSLIKSAIDSQNIGKWKNILHRNSFPLAVQFSSIFSTVETSDSSNFKSSPFKSSQFVSMPVNVYEIPVNEPWAEQITTVAESLLELQLVDTENVIDKLKCLILRPLYKNTNSSISSDGSCPRLRSQFYSKLVAINCLVCTQQEGFVYHFPVDKEGQYIGKGKCISSYHFTSPVISVALELNLLHALTETGLETYTLRTAHHALQSFEEVDHPSPSDPVSLIGLRPFLGVINLLLCDTYLVIVASSNDRYNSSDGTSLWTMYSLQLPSAATLYTDILALAANNRFNSPVNYLLLLSEAHMILKSSVNLCVYHKSSPMQINVELYRESCLILADHLLCSDSSKDWRRAAKLYLSALLTPIQVMERIKKIESDAKEANVSINVEKGLTYYLKSCFEFWPDINIELSQSTMTVFLDLLENSNQMPLLPHLVLQHSFIREVLRERILNSILELLNGMPKQSDAYFEATLALSLLYLQKGCVNEALNNLNLCIVSEDVCNSLFITYPHLLFESSKLSSGTEKIEFTAFSELATLVIDVNSSLFCEVLLKLVENRYVNLQTVMKMFLRYLVTCTGTSQVKTSQCLQIFLECYFSSLKVNDAYNANPVIKEALKILMRSYLSDLKLNTSDKLVDSHLNENAFNVQYPEFLKVLPDFSCQSQNCQSLKKLQLLILSGWLDSDALNELSSYINEVLPDYLSLKVLAEPSQAVDILYDQCPDALMQYAEDTFKSEDEWKNLVQKLYDTKKEDQETSETVKSGESVYSNLLKNVLQYLAHNLSMEEFCRILPNDFDSSFHEYIVRCQDICHSNAIRALIVSTGYQLLSSKYQ